MTETSLYDVVSGGPQNPRRRSQRAAEKRRRRRRRRTGVIVLVALLLLGAAGAGAWLGLRPVVASLRASSDYTGEGTTPVVVVTIPDGASGAQIGGVLERAGVVKTARAFVDAYQSTPAASGIQPGTYRLRAKMSSAAAVAALLDTRGRLVTRVTIPEGKRLVQIIDLLAKATRISKQDFQAAMANPDAIGLPPSAKGNAEGYLFPATYDLQPGATATTVLAEMVQRSESTLRSLGVPQAKEHAVLTLASIVQSESGNVADMGKVARVFVNRLNGLSGTHKMESDATVSYATNTFGITTTDKQRSSPSRYNTYRWPGLPPGPISSPGAEAIRAAMSPTPGKWLYFVTINPDTGDTRFALTLAQHRANTRLFLTWLKAHPGRH